MYNDIRMKVRVFCSITMIAVLVYSTAFPIAAKDEPSPPVPEEYQELTDPVPPTSTPSPHTDEIPVSVRPIDKLIDYIQKNGIASEDGKSLYLYDILSAPSEILLTYYPDTDTIQYLSGRRIAEEDGTEVTKACSITYHITEDTNEPAACIYRYNDAEDHVVYYADAFDLHEWHITDSLRFHDENNIVQKALFTRDLNNTLRESIEALNAWMLTTAPQTDVLSLNELGFIYYADASQKAIEDFVEHSYSTCFDRSADRDGLLYWISYLYTQQTTPQDLLSIFLQSPEYIERSQNNTGFILTLYHAFLDREPDPESLAEWLHMLENGIQREAVIGGFADSAEFDELLRKKHLYELK